MDLKALKEQALLETGRFFLEKFGAAPAEDSEEWEDEYRRHFNRLKKGATPHATAAESPSAIIEQKPVDLPDLTGTAADARWAFALRSERLKQVQNHDLRAWLARTWVRAKAWIDTRDLSTEAFLRRVEPPYRDASRRHAAEAAAAAATRTAQAAAAAVLQDQIKAAGITAAGLVDLIDVSPRAAVMPIKDKLAELRLENRALRVFETTNPAILMVLERRDDQRNDYGIERDEGLVADLKLFARSGL
jgi:hypothetical protein